MKEKGKRAEEIKRLHGEVIRVQMATFEAKESIHPGRPNLEPSITLCRINGVKYAMLQDIKDFTNAVNLAENRGKFDENATIHGYYGGTIRVLTRVDDILRFWPEYDRYIARDNERWWYAERAHMAAMRVLLMYDGNDIPENTFTEERLTESEAAYVRRNELIQEGAEERRREKEQAELEQAKADMKKTGECISDFYAEEEKRQKWEYKVISNPFQSAMPERMLNEAGSDGWELIAIAMPANQYIFKRPIIKEG